MIIEYIGDKEENRKEDAIKKIKSKLCNEGHDGNAEVNEHFVKEHIQIMNVSNTVKNCGYIFSMDITQDKCSQFCIFYKNSTELRIYKF